jgi:hypothetical protein
MNYALVKAGRVENIIMADPSFIHQIKGHWDEIILLSGAEGEPAIGHEKDVNGVFQPPAPPAPVPPPVDSPEMARIKTVDLSHVTAIAALKPILMDIVEILKDHDKSVVKLAKRGKA